MIAKILSLSAAGLLLTTGSLAVAAAPAEDVWTEIKTKNANQLVFEVTQSADGNGQAAEYASAEKVALLYDRLLADPKSQLAKVVAQTMKANGCKPDGTYADAEIGGGLCGYIPAPAPQQNTVLVNFGRGGWASAGATFWSFHTFTSDGSGRFTEPVFAAQWSVGVEAKSESLNEGQPAVFTVTIQYEGIRSTAKDSFKKSTTRKR